MIMPLENNFYNIGFIDKTKNFISIEESVIGANGRINVLMNKDISIFGYAKEIAV